MNIGNLRMLVSNGWNIANRKVLSNKIGETELSQLKTEFKKLRINDEFPSLNGSPHTTWIPSEDIMLLNTGKNLKLKLSTYINGFYTPKSSHLFENSEINLHTIKERIKAYETNIIEKFKSAKELTPDSLTSKTIEKLYSKHFNPLRRVNEDGYRITTLIEKETGKPVEAYIKQLSTEDDYEKYGIFIKNAQNEYELAGSCSFIIKHRNKLIYADWMETDIWTNKYAGTGLRCHQIGVE